VCGARRDAELIELVMLVVDAPPGAVPTSGATSGTSTRAAT